MTPITSAIPSLAKDAVQVKAEYSLAVEPVEGPTNVSQEPRSNPPRKRKRQSTTEYITLDIDDDTFEQLVKTERIDDSQKGGKPKPTTRARKAPVGRYQDTCRHYKKEFSSLPDPRHVLTGRLLDSYKKSIELAAFMKVEYEEKHSEFLALREAKIQLNTKLRAQKTALAEAKEVCQKAEIQAAVFKKSYDDANLQLTLKVARPVSQAQIKLENVHEDYTNDLVDLRRRLAQKEAEKKMAEDARIAAETELARLRAAGAIQSPEITQETSDLRKELEHVQKLRENAESSAAKLSTTNAELESKFRELEERNKRLEADIEERNRIAEEQKPFLDAIRVIQSIR